MTVVYPILIFIVPHHRVGPAPATARYCTNNATTIAAK